MPQQTLAGFFGNPAGMKTAVAEESPGKSGDENNKPTAVSSPTGTGKGKSDAADAIQTGGKIVDVKTKEKPVETTTKDDEDDEDEDRTIGRRRARSSVDARALEDDYEEDEDEDEDDDSDMEDDIEDVEIGAPKTGKMPTKAKKAKKEEASGVGVGDKSVEAAERYLEYDPEKAVTWKKGEPTPYLYLANIFESIAETTKRLEIAELLTNAFRTILASRPDDLLAAVYLASNTIAPQHEGIDLGIGDATLIKCLAEATGRKDDAIKSDYKEAGDLGSVAMASRATQRMMFPPPPLTISGVLKEFRAIATTDGEKSVDRKKAKIKKLLVSARDCEAGYVIRSLQGKLRIGLAQQTVTQSLAHAVVLHAKTGKKGAELADALSEAFDVVKQVFSECPTFDQIVPALLEAGIDGLQERCKFTPGVPVKPMLAKPTTGVSEVLKRFEEIEFTCEYK